MGRLQSPKKPTTSNQRTLSLQLPAPPSRTPLSSSLLSPNSGPLSIGPATRIEPTAAADETQTTAPSPFISFRLPSPSSTTGTATTQASTSTAPLSLPIRSTATATANPTAETSPSTTTQDQDPPPPFKRGRSRANKKKNPSQATTHSSNELEPADVEEGEVQGDFDGLFVVDLQPSVVPKELLETPTPSKEHEHPNETAYEHRRRQQADDLEKEEQAMRDFAHDVLATDDDDDNDDDDNDDDDNDDDDNDDDDNDDHDEADENGQQEEEWHDEASLAKAIQGRIVDDSQAKVTGRYYKEADLTKSCVLCGEQGHSSRDCTHSQCFICAQVDADHEARNCPVSLICSACGSRGHMARDCTAAHPIRGNYGARCTHCSSTLHLPTNCPTLWRIYDTRGAKPTKRKVILACANCGSNKDHFIDNCPIPRGHPMKYVDNSAFNREALGDWAIGLPSRVGRRGGPTGPEAAARRRGQPMAGDKRRTHERFDPADDDDWFASRRTDSARRDTYHHSRERDHGRSNLSDRLSYGDDRSSRSASRDTRPSASSSSSKKHQRSQSGSESTPRGTRDSSQRGGGHVRFNESTYDRFGGTPTSGPGSGRKDLRSTYDDDDRRQGGRDNGRDSGRDSSRRSARNGNGRSGKRKSDLTGAGGSSGTSSLSSLALRLGGLPTKPRYEGGYY